MKTELQRLADQTGLALTVAHLPPGTSKWNRIEYRLFDIITHNWRVKPNARRLKWYFWLRLAQTGSDWLRP